MMKLQSTISILAILLLLMACEKAEVVPTSTCNAGPSSTHSKAELFQSVIDEYTERGLPGISLLIRDQEGEWSNLTTC